MDVFLSWSGTASKQIAELLRDWLPRVIQRSKPWVSSQDISSGQRWFEQISKAATSDSFGIFFLTPENINSQWIHYEAGALSRISSDTRITGLLLQELKPSQISGPLAHYQHQSFNKEGVQSLIIDMNQFGHDGFVSEEILIRAFENEWPELEAKYRNIISNIPLSNPAPERSTRDMIEEVLELTRSMHWDSRKVPKHIETTLGLVEAQYRQMAKDMNNRGEGLPPAPKRAPIHGESVSVYRDGRIKREEIKSKDHKDDIFD